MSEVPPQPPQPPPPPDRPDQPVAPQYGPPSYPPYPDAQQPVDRRAVGAAAEWWRRLVAIILDGLILSIPNAILSALFGINATEVDPETDLVSIDPAGFAALMVVSLIVTCIYSGILEGSSHGQSVGKMAMRIQVRDADTLGPIGFGRAASRRFVYQILFLPLFIPGLINGLSPLWDARRQAWHDKTAKTLVVNSG